MAARQASPSLGFSRQEHWSGLAFPSPMHESEKWKVRSLSRIQLLATLWTVAYQAPPSMGFSRQEYWRGVPLPSPRRHIKKQRHHFANKGLYSQSYGFSSSHVKMWDLDHKKGWAPKNWFLWTVVLEKTLESSLDCKEIKSVNSKGNQPWIFHWKDWCWSSNTLATWCKELTHCKTPWYGDVGKDWRQEEKGMTEDEVVGWYYRLNGHEFE